MARASFSPGGSVIVETVERPAPGIADIIWRTAEGYEIARMNATQFRHKLINDIVAALALVEELPDGFAMKPGAGLKIMTQSGYILGEVGGVTGVSRFVGLEGGTASAFAETATDEQVAAVLTNDVEEQPFLVGDNCLLCWTESKTVSQLNTSLASIMTDGGTTLPAGATVSSRLDSHPGHTIAELQDSAEVASLKSVIDAHFTAGGEAISTVALVCMANDIIAGTTADDWEAAFLTAKALVQRYSMQKYLGTDPDAPMPVPPITMTVDCTYSEDPAKTRVVPLRAIEMSRRIYDLCMVAPDYICEMAANQGDLTPDATGVHWTGGTGGDIQLMSDYHALAADYWRRLHKKYNGAQVIDGWTDGVECYLRVSMPHKPLVFDSTFVAAIADQGLSIVTATGVVPTISNLEIIGGGEVIHFTSSATLAGGGKARGAWEPTLAGTNGRNSGARMTIHDSSEYVGRVGRTLHAYLLPFEFTFA